MLFKSAKDLKSFEAGDKTTIIEILHPQNDPVPPGYSLAHASLEIGTASIPHILKECSETYYILNGMGKVVIDQETQVLEQGDTVYIPKGAIQHIENIGTTRLEFLCIVAPAWYAEQEVIL